MRAATQARVRQQLRRTLRDIRSERCRHLEAVQVGAFEAHQLQDGSWLYEATYQCPCGARFVESHAQSSPRDAVG